MKHIHSLLALSALALFSCGGSSATGANTSSESNGSSTAVSSGVTTSSGSALSSGTVQSSGSTLSSGAVSSATTSSGVATSSAIAKSSTAQSSTAISSATTSSTTTTSSSTATSSAAVSSSTVATSSSSEVIVNGVTTITDARDGQTYRITKIGTQVWMAQNLNYGTMITQVTPQRNDAVQEKYCYNDDPANCTTYGALYQWQEAMQIPGGCVRPYSPPENFTYAQCETPALATIRHQGLCPLGWHIPDTSEYRSLLNKISVDGYAANNGQVLRNAGFGSTGLKGLDVYKFDALGAGEISGNFLSTGSAGNSSYINSVTWFWTSSIDTTGTYLPYGMSIQGNSLQVDYSPYETTSQTGFSVRCLRDN